MTISGNKIKVNISIFDHVHYKTSDETCSRCRRKLLEDEVPLRFWPESNTDYMLIYCEDCSPDLLAPADLNRVKEDE